MNRIEIGKRVKDERNKNGWSQENLADDTKVSIRTIQRIEKGEDSIGKDTLLQVLEFLSIEYCDDGYVSIPELSSVSLLVDKLSKYDYDIKKGDFEIDDLEIILKFANFLDDFKGLNFKEVIRREIELKKVLRELSENNIKIFSRLSCDATIIDNRMADYGIYKEDYIILEIYIFKNTDFNVLKKKNGSTYINIVNNDFSNLISERCEYGIYDIEKYPHLFTSEEHNDYIEKQIKNQEKLPF